MWKKVFQCLFGGGTVHLVMEHDADEDNDHDDDIEDLLMMAWMVVRDMIATRAGLKKVPWDGYLKYFRPSPKLTERKQQIFAESVLQRLEK